MTDANFNKTTGLPIVSPVTRTDWKWRTHVPLVAMATTGLIMVEQLKSVDWVARGAAFIERVPQALFDDVRSRIATMLGI
jgi:mRNA interferase MazF